ncbi:MAG: NAD(P)H-hydrate dehydratase, partial [Acutalibacteraceae bacterium]|nr:NAD(P)H-hydrate dehydratase [Acutalibacteraceae bacterium]
LKGADAVLAGCGMGNNADTAKIVNELVRNTEVPLIIDADGINAIGASIDIIKKCKAPVIITPHPGEMARLLNTAVSEVEADRVSCARTFAQKYGCTVILKGANTVIAAENGDIFFNCTGNPGMSTGGSGDVLSGIVTALSAQGMPPLEAAKAAVYLHGEAGDKAALKKGQRALIPSDIIEEL